MEGVAVEQVVVLDVAGAIADFYKAVRRSGLQWLIDADGDASSPDEDFRLVEDAFAEVPNKLFLILTDQAAIASLLSLWRRYKESGRAAFAHGFTSWFHVFEQLRDVRLWNIHDRVSPDTRSYWQSRLEAGDAEVRTEIELWYSESDPKNVEWANSLRALLGKSGGTVIDAAEIPHIRYHAFLADLPAATIQAILTDATSPLAVTGQIMYYRPQFRGMARSGGTETAGFGQQRPVPTEVPVVAILDGVPLQNHELLAGRIILDDPNNLQGMAVASDRVHGTSMASIVLHGDLNGQTPTIASRVVVHPILIPDPQSSNSPPEEVSLPNRLLLDVIHVAVRRLVEGSGGEAYPVAPSVPRVINLSIGDFKREFARSMSPLARLLDWLAWRYQLLFVVPVGNLASVGSGIELDVPREDFAALSPDGRSAATFDAIEGDTQFRRLLSPGESLNAITVGGVYSDGSTFSAPAGRFPLFAEAWPCPEGRFGPGFLKSVKPDLVAASGRRLFSEKLGNAHTNATLVPIDVSTPPGILSAAPSPQAGILSHAKYSAGTSNAAALVSHATAQAFSALSALREVDGSLLPMGFDAVLLKALAVHSCHWRDTAALQAIFGTISATERKKRLSRLFGYGVLEIDRLRGCTDERATLLAVADIAADEGWEYRVPLPPSLAATKHWRRITITLAWLSPINPQHRDYRRAIVWFTCDRSTLKVTSAGADWQAMRRGSIQHDVWEGDKAAAYTDGTELRILVSCAADAGELIERVPYALCVSIEVAPGVELPIYEEIAARISVPLTVPVI